MRQVLGAAAVLLVVMVACGDDDIATTEVPATEAPTVTTLQGGSMGEPVAAGRPVIVDYSPTVSDVGALAFVAAHPELRLIGVTLPGTGESHCEPGVVHTRGILVELGLGEVPVSCGPDQPTTGWNAFPTSWRVASDEMDLPEAAPNETTPAPRLIVQLVAASDVPVEILAVGPLTNLAHLLIEHPSVVDGLAGITIMGGAVDVPGNVIRNEVGEWNIWVDPTAAGEVFSSGVPVTLVPLDATDHLPTGPVFFESLDAQADTAASRLVRDLWASNPHWIENEGRDFYFWDELAAAVLVDESIVTFENRTLVVDDDLRENKGWTREDPTGTAVRVATSTDRLAFEQLFLETLIGGSAELRYVTATPREIEYLQEMAVITRDSQEAFDAELDAVATELGFDPNTRTEEDFLAVFGVALPRILDGPVVELAARLVALDVPLDLAVTHEDFVAATRAIVDARDEIIAAFEANPGFDALGEWFERFSEACSAIQDAADARLVDVTISC